MNFQELLDEHGVPEKWLPVVGHEDKYLVSNLGRVLSKARIVRYYDNRWKRWTRRILPEKMLEGHEVNGGYIIVDLDDGCRYFVHQLVLTAFKGPCPEGLISRHLDGNGSNNKETNLCWGTYTENNQDKIRHGTICCGSRVNTAKFNEEQVLQIRNEIPNTTPPNWKKIREKAIKYNVTPGAVHAIVARKNWKHI